MYIEASAKGRKKNAIIYSPLYRGMERQCLEFYYHMFGRHIGTLNVYAKVGGVSHAHAETLEQEGGRKEGRKEEEVEKKKEQ